MYIRHDETHEEAPQDLSAIGKSLRDQYETLSPPIPPRLATLVERLEANK